MSARSRQPLLARLRRRVRGGAVRPASSSVRSSSTARAPHASEAVEEHTNIGPMMDALVARVKRNQKPWGVDPDYDLVRENFDHVHYMLQAETLHEIPDADPVRNFLRKGAGGANSPDYNFSMKSYLDRYPHRRNGPEDSPYLEWIKHGRAAGEIADPAQGIEQMAGALGLEPAQIVDQLVATRTDMMERLRTGTLGEMFAKAAKIEPLIGAQWAETTRTRMIPLGAKTVAGQIAAIRACHVSAGFRRARLLLVVDRPRGRAGRLVEGHLAHALSGYLAPDRIVVIYTDASGQAPNDRFPAGVREVDFAAESQGLPDEHKQLALVALVRSFDADAIVNIDSGLFYRVLAPYGKALAATERIFLFFAGDEQRAAGHWEGWSQLWFYAGFDLVAGFITDSAQLRDRLGDRYQLREEDKQRIHVMNTLGESGSESAYSKHAAAVLFGPASTGDEHR